MGIGAFTRVVAVVLVAVGVAGFSGVLGWHSAVSFYHLGVGLLFVYAGFVQRDPLIVRQIVDGLGALLVVVKAITIVIPLVAWGHPPRHGPLQVTCLLVGVLSNLAARYLRDEEGAGGAS